MTYRTKPTKHKVIGYDLIVIGAGLAGAMTAKMIASKGKKVAVIDQKESARNIPKTVTNPRTKKKHKIAVIHGHAHFLDPWTISVAGTRFKSHHFLVATGSHTPRPSLPGLKENGFLTAEQAMKSNKLPKKIVVIGDSSQSSELSFILAEGGKKVLLLDESERLMDNEDQEFSDHLEQALESAGVNIVSEARALMVRKKGQQKIVSYKKHEKVHTITADEIVLADRKIPNIDLGLENAKIEYTRDEGVHVDSEMVTSNRHIYAAGGVIGHHDYPHVAEYEGRIAGNNMFSELKHRANYRAVPRILNVFPEIAATGATEQILKKKYKKLQISHVDFDIAEEGTEKKHKGYVKIIADKKGYILGASVVTPHANEMIHELTLAIQWKIKASKIDYTMHAYPSWSRYIQECASKIVCR